MLLIWFGIEKELSWSSFAGLADMYCCILGGCAVFYFNHQNEQFGFDKMKSKPRYHADQTVLQVLLKPGKI